MSNDEETMKKMVAAKVLADKRMQEFSETSYRAVAGYNFNVGDLVKKITGDYTFEGVVVASFEKINGIVRYVVEDDRGALHIYSAKNLGLRGEDAN